MVNGNDLCGTLLKSNTGQLELGDRFPNILLKSCIVFRKRKTEQKENLRVPANSPGARTQAGEEPRARPRPRLPADNAECHGTLRDVTCPPKNCSALVLFTSCCPHSALSDPFIKKSNVNIGQPLPYSIIPLCRTRGFVGMTAGQAT